MKYSALAAIIVALSLPALADDKHHNKSQSASQGASQSEGMAEGEIRRVDKDAKKITIKHGPLQSLDMPAMTMVFQVKDPAMLEKVKVGDKIRFAAEKVGGGYAVTRIEPAR